MLIEEVGGAAASGTYDRYSDDGGFDRDDDGLGVLPGGLHPCPREFEDDVCCLLLV